MIQYFHTLQNDHHPNSIRIITYEIFNCHVLQVRNLKLKEVNLNAQTHPITHRLCVPEQVS